MAFRWKACKSSRSNLRRLAGNQFSGAIEELAAPSADRAETIHNVRLRLKKLRSLLRLTRLAAPHRFQVENAALRDAARALSASRDRQITIAALDKLLSGVEGEGAEPEETAAGDSLDALRELRERFVEAQRQETQGVDLDCLGRLAAEQLRQAADRLDAWTAAARDDQVIAAGFSDTYRRARKALRAALADPTAENLHEWRKQTKYHRYQASLFQDAWPAVFTAHCDELKRLSDLLGDDHDLVVLEQAAAGLDAASPSSEALTELRRLIERRRRQLQAAALPLGRLLFAEKPKLLTRRLLRYWRLRPPVPNMPLDRARPPRQL